MNYKTVASFASDEIILKQYEQYIEGPTKKNIRQAHFMGVSFGFSQFIQNVVFGILYLAGSEFNFNDNTVNGEHVFKAMFAMMFGAMAAAQAN